MYNIRLLLLYNVFVVSPYDALYYGFHCTGNDAIRLGRRRPSHGRSGRRCEKVTKSNGYLSRGKHRETWELTYCARRQRTATTVHGDNGDMVPLSNSLSVC